MAQIPANTFTPAELQGYVLRHRDAPADAMSQMGRWAKEEREEAAKEIVEDKDNTKNRVSNRGGKMRESPPSVPFPVSFILLLLFSHGLLTRDRAVSSKLSYRT